MTNIAQIRPLQAVVCVFLVCEISSNSNKRPVRNPQKKREESANKARVGRKGKQEAKSIEKIRQRRLDMFLFFSFELFEGNKNQ